MDIHIITFNSVPESAYQDPLIALKRYRTLSEDTDVIGDYGIISLPIQDASQPGIEADAESRCPKCGETEPVLHCENCGHKYNRTA